VNTAANLIHLAANPYLLWMFLNVYGALGHIPANRGGLFDEFVFQLLKREGLAQGDRPNDVGKRLSGSLEELAWKLQSQVAAEADEPGRGVELTLPRADAVAVLGGEQSLHRAAAANLLEDAEPVRFTHQLLQEYFSARRLLTEIGNRLSPNAFWPSEHWWQASGWEEAVVLAAGLSAEAAGTVFHWVLPANPEVAADCIQRSGRAYDDATRLALRAHWLDPLTDHKVQPEPARAAIGRALGSVLLSSGEALDNRPGVGLRADGVPDIDWVDIPGGRVVLEGSAGEQTLKDFAIARYPVTHRQFQAFIDAADGYRNAAWWEDLEAQEPAAPYWSEANAPRETVSWYEAVAFCRWLSARLGYAVRLPTEFQWQQAATGGDAQREYPWGDWKEGRCNSDESGLERTSAVGLYPHGSWTDGPLDMAGNVWEWCLNKFDKPKNDRIDRSADWRVLRGGSWDDVSGRCRAAYRYHYSPGYRSYLIGFRLLRPPSPDH
jgi:formylglycine-generating enzyme required for sulfatase activity